MKKIRFGSKEIDYHLTFADRRTLGITVSPDMAVTVRAPHRAPLQKIKQILTKRAPWILRQQEYFLAFYPKQSPKRYVNGETHLYLGKQYRLRVVRSRKESVKLDGGYIFVRCRNHGRGRRLLQNWYLERAGEKFDAYSLKWIKRFRKYGKAPTALTMRHMPKRWGSCTPKGKIILNPELVKAPKACIEYVIIHELCHLIHRNHTKKFIELQAELMPSWEKWKMTLEKLLS
jgi:predicted metal-dependent hydrolase